jgi:transposase
MPGFGDCFGDLWESGIAITLARHGRSAQGIIDLGRERLIQLILEQHGRCWRRTVDRVLAWASTAPPADPDGDIHHRMWCSLEDDHSSKRRQIESLERELASLLVGTPYVLLLSIPGINVVSAAEFAGEMGPIEHYANARCITGRAGLFPSRYQSDLVDRANGPLVRGANRRLRAVILGIADNLIRCNDHFRAKVDVWKALGKNPRTSHVKVGMRFTRIAYQMVAGGQVFHHPCGRNRSYILDKLVAFHREHRTPSTQILADLRAASELVPAHERRAEGRPLVQWIDKSRIARSHETQLIGEIIPLVLAQLGVDPLEFDTSGGQGSSSPGRVVKPTTSSRTMG